MQPTKSYSVAVVLLTGLRGDPHAACGACWIGPVLHGPSLGGELHTVPGWLLDSACGASMWAPSGLWSLPCAFCPWAGPMPFIWPAGACEFDTLA